MTENQNAYDALLVVSFGGPDGPDDVMPFLENVLRGRNVPHERMLEVAEHYQHFGGVSPINAQNRALIAAINQEFRDHHLDLPVYFGNRNWHPLFADTLRQMQQDGVRNALAFFTSMFSCYSGCRQYRENLAAAQQQIGSGAPTVQKLRMAFNHPLFIEASADRVRTAFAEIPATRRAQARLIFTAHSIPMSMAAGSQYASQLQEASRLIAEAVGHSTWDLVYQSRSGPPSQPWLEPDVLDHIEQLHQQGETRDVVLMPVGFVSDHMEVLYDLDTEARQTCDQLGIRMARAATVGTHPAFVSMIRELVNERLLGEPRRAVGSLPPGWDICPADCCQYQPGPPPVRKPS